jgi:carbonic anhydrase/acetyltransferase-like protein (isoleucine patch superfamily)
MTAKVQPASIHPSAFVAPGAVVLGEVTIGPRASVWFNTVVRGDSAPVVIGEDSNVQDNSVVHEDVGYPALIGARVTIGHRAIIHGCVIEDDCLIGMGSVILSGARIGTGSYVGAASLVREGQAIPPGSLVVGSPARVIGPVKPQHQSGIRIGATHYADLAQTYRRHGLARGAGRDGAVTRDRGSVTRREWNDLVRTLEEGPSWITARSHAGAHPDAEGYWAELAALDLERLPLVEQVVRGEEPLLHGESPGRAAGAVGGRSKSAKAWAEARATLCRLLESLGPEAWIQVAGHPDRGPLTLGELVREWVDDDLARRREIAARLSERA